MKEETDLSNNAIDPLLLYGLFVNKKSIEVFQSFKASILNKRFDHYFNNL